MDASLFIRDEFTVEIEKLDNVSEIYSYVIRVRTANDHLSVFLSDEKLTTFIMEGYYSYMKEVMKNADS
jgi:hypothetical protein